MARDSDRGILAGFLDRLLGRRPQERAPDSKPLFTAHQPPPAAHAGAPEARSEPLDEPEPAATAQPEPDDEDGLNTAVHADALERAARRARTTPDVRVHDGHLEDRARPVELTPSQALELARGGRDRLRRRDRE